MRMVGVWVCWGGGVGVVDLFCPKDLFCHTIRMIFLTFIFDSQL